MSDLQNDTASVDKVYKAQARDFVAPMTQDEFLHDDEPGADHTLSETSYLGFYVPEAGISCEIYHWFHPRFSLASGGVMIFEGHHTRTGEAAYADYRNFMPIPADISSVTYETGVSVRVVVPMQELHVTFVSPDRTVSFDVNLRAIMPAAGRADRQHFVQAMRATGELVLHGQRHAVDSYFTRDRSYRTLRAELSHPVPPVGWGAAVFGDDLAFHFVGGAGTELSAEALRWGYVWRDGKLLSPARLHLVTHRGDDGVTPTGFDVELEDETGRVHRLRGTVRSQLPMNFWPNMVTQLALCAWEYNGLTGHGEFQDVAFGPWLREARHATLDHRRGAVTS